MANERKTAKLPQMAQMRRKRRHGYPQIGEGIGVYRYPSKTVSVLSVVQKTLCDEERSECARVVN